MDAPEQARRARMRVELGLERAASDIRIRRADRGSPCVAPIAKPATAMPSNTRPAWELQQHAVLEGAGLALVGVADDIVLGAGRIARSLPFESPVGKPAPPRPRRLERFISSSMPWRPSAIAASSARPGVDTALPSSGAGAPDVVVDAEELAPASRSSGLRALIRSLISSMRSLVEAGDSAILLTSIAGPWSHMPVHEVRSMLTRPSARDLAAARRRNAEHALEQLDAARMRSVMLSENSTR